MNNHYLVFDIETKREFADVGGRNRVGQLGVSVVGTYDSLADKYKAYREEEFEEFEEILKAKPLLIGFNSKGFDIPALQPYVHSSLSSLPQLDIMDYLTNYLGYRVSLDSVSKGTINAGKIGHGLKAIELYRKGKWDELIEYCLQDVKLTRDIYEYGRENGNVKFFAGWETYEVPVRWK